jgi:hypothetical protein
MSCLTSPIASNGAEAAAFRDRGATHVNLKTHRVGNGAAVRLYERLGMIRVTWEG